MQYSYDWEEDGKYYSHKKTDEGEYIMAPAKDEYNIADVENILINQREGDEYSYDDYSEDNYYDTPDNYDYGDNYAVRCKC